MGRLRGLDGAARGAVEDALPRADLELFEAAGYTEADQDE